MRLHVKERILTIRLLDKASKYPASAAAPGIVSAQSDEKVPKQTVKEIVEK